MDRQNYGMCSLGEDKQLSKRLLSYGGKEIFIKVNLVVGKGEWKILVYAPLENFVSTKKDEGIGIHDIRLFNITLLGRQVWRLINNKDSICFKVLSSEYFPDGNIFNAKRVEKASFTWSSIAAVAVKLKRGFGWQVGNGDSINIRDDNWGFEELNESTIISSNSNHELKSVRDLLLVNDRKWDMDKVYMVYGKDWGDRIYNLPIGNEGQRDRMVWFHNPYGYFRSKSAYSWLLLKEIGFGPHRIYWKSIWKIDTLPKIWVFAWRVGHEILPTNVKISSIRIGFNKKCSRCEATNETLLHALRDCPTSREVLLIKGWDMRVMTEHYDRCIDWASNLGKEFRICNLLYAPMLPQNDNMKKWDKPPKGVVKINFDATMNGDRAGYGVIFRDNDGFVLGGGEDSSMKKCQSRRLSV
ncbi:hypothetical protein CXB51_010474 [Gossypium anomalum]|uniref:Reverse transcriptase zinc-binding domain-containing protein n=1 Tax=Gossypium anomalum TaxID=47600 RepID=A0A8J5ZCK8_9ROSI|nr:hypothetical protein CXB51_010474 [Gossypium anomalum]